MALSVTPARLEQPIIDFCNELNPHTEPRFVELQFVPGSSANECFINVRKHIEKHGGSIAYGWAVFSWPGVYSEAIYHGVWIDPAGNYIDITPKDDGEERILFVENSELVFDETSISRRGTIYKPLRNCSIVKRYIANAKQRFHLMEENRTKRKISINPAKMTRLTFEAQDLKAALLKKYLGPNDPCPCGSGKKYKKCNCYPR